jgi:hypothetical protein
MPTVIRRSREVDPVTLTRIRNLLKAAAFFLPSQITTGLLARMLVQADGGPMLDAPRLGPALRQLGFCRVRCRRGAHRLAVWFPPGVSPPKPGRPRGHGCRRRPISLFRLVN